MNSIIQQITDWLKGILVSGIMDNLTNTFSSVNDQVGQIATEVGKTPSNFMPAVFNMVRNLSESVIMPVAGILLTFIACYELIQLIISYNNLASFETWFIWKWIFKTFVAVELITHTFDITMAVFDVSQSVVRQAGGIIQGSTAVDASTLATMQSTLEAMELGPLFAIFLQSFIVQFLMYVLSAVIFVIINGRMVEIYLMVSLAPLPFATFGNREQSMMGQNYMRSLFALGFQGFLIMVCVGIYAVLIQSVAFSSSTQYIPCTLRRQSMAASYISVPRDLTKVKSKVMFNLTKRQLICFGMAVLIGVQSFFLMKTVMKTNTAVMGMMVIMMPFFFLAMYEKNGQPLEVILNHMIQAVFKRPKIRPYKTDNYYAALLRQAEAEKEVEKIVRLSQKEKSGEQEVHNAGRIKQSRPDGSKGDRKKCPEK